MLQADEVSGPDSVVVIAEADNADLLGQLVVARIQNVDGTGQIE